MTAGWSLRKEHGENSSTPALSSHPLASWGCLLVTKQEKPQKTAPRDWVGLRVRAPRTPVDRVGREVDAQQRRSCSVSAERLG